MDYQKIKLEIIENLQTLLKLYSSLLSPQELIMLKKKQILIKRQEFNSYKELKQVEIELLPYFARVWQVELTNLDNFREGESFKFLLHCPTVLTDKMEKRLDNIISTSLITDKHFGTFNNIHYGLICSCNANNLMAINEDDSHAMVAREDEVIAQSYFYAGMVDDAKQLYTKKYVMSLKFPNQIENKMILENMKYNGSLYSTQGKDVYCDISLRSKDTDFLAVAILDMATEKERLEAEKLATKFNLKCIEIPSKLYAEKYEIKKEKNKQIYDLLDLDSVYYILHHLEQLKEEYSNLIISQLENKIYIKSDVSKDYVIYDIYANNVIICPQNDTRLFKVQDFMTFYIDDKVIHSKERFNAELHANNLENEFRRR